MSFEPRDYVRHIAVEIDYLIGQTHGLTFEAFVANETLRRAFVRSLEIIGEAARKFRRRIVSSIPTSLGARWLECATA